MLHLGTLELPGDPCHDVHGVRSSHADADGAQAAAVWRVGVCADEHHAGVGVVLQDDLAA